jgi:hypothetical protein
MHTHTKQERSKYRQNFVAFKKATCKNCNSYLLGQLYDPALIDFCAKVKNLAAAKEVLPCSRFVIEIQPLPIIKAILGHLMAASTIPTDTWLDLLARDSVCHENLPVNSELHLFYWYYPFPEDVVISRDFGMPSIRGRISSKAEVFAMIKFYPLAFLVTKASHYADLQELTTWRNVPINAWKRVEFELCHDKEADWPERVDDKNFVMYGQPAHSSVIAKKR